MQLPEIIEGNRIKLRRLRKEDAPVLFRRISSNPSLTKYVSFPTHTSIEETYNYLQRTSILWDQGEEFSYGIIQKGTSKLMGTIGAKNEEGNVIFGYIIIEELQGKGFATEAVKLLIKELARQKDAYRIWAYSDAENIASIKVLEKAGLQREALIKNWEKFINQDNKPKDCVFFNYEF